jgi:hypothetical protein
MDHAIGAKTTYTERRSPRESGYIESFNACLRDELLKGTQSSLRSTTSLEDRQRYHRALEPHWYRARIMRPKGRHVQSRRAQAATVWTISPWARGAMMPR